MKKSIAITVLTFVFGANASTETPNQDQIAMEGMDKAADLANRAKASLPPIKHSFAKIDSDSSGSISVSEADSHTILEHYGYIDKNNDFVLSESEFNSYVKKWGYTIDRASSN